MWVPYTGANRIGILKMLAEKTGIELTRKGLPPLAKLQKHIAAEQRDHGYFSPHLPTQNPYVPKIPFTIISTQFT